MSRHPFHVQDCESIWHLWKDDDDDDDTELNPLSFSFQSTNAFVSKFPRKGEMPQDWTASTTKDDKQKLRAGVDSTPVLESDVNATGINVTLQKYGAAYSLWIDGRVSSKDTHGVHRLPSYDAYYRQIEVDGTKEKGVLTPVNFSALLEDGERPPERIILKTYQVRRRAGALMRREVIGETELKATSANDIVGNCVVMPYPCAYTQKPYVTIRDVGASKLARLREAGGQAYHMITLALSLVLKYAIGVATNDGSATLLRRSLSKLGTPTGSKDKATWIQWIDALLSYGIPSMTLLGFTVATFTNWWIGLGMVTSLQSLSTFLTTAFKLSEGAGESGPLASILSLFPAGGAAILARKGWQKILPTSVLWMAKNVLSARPQPEVRRVRYTPMDLVESIRAIFSSDATAISAFEYKEKVLLEWMLEPSVSDEGRMRKAMRVAQNYIGKAVLGSSNLFPRSGACLLDGYEILNLAKDTMDIEYEVVVIDQSLCDPRPITMTIRGDVGSMLNGGLLSAGIIEDNELLEKTIKDAVEVISSPENTWRVFHTIIGIPMQYLPSVVPEELKKNYDAEAVVVFREKLLYGLERINVEVRQAALDPFVNESKSRDQMVIFNHQRFDFNNTVRLLPQRLVSDTGHVAAPRKSDLSNIRYDTVAADDVPGSHTTAVFSTPAIAEKENKFVSDAAKRAHEASSNCIKGFARLWRMGSGRPVIWQLFRKSMEGGKEFTPVELDTLARSIKGEPLSDRMIMVNRSHIPFAYNYPSDIAFLSTEYDTNLAPIEQDMSAMVERNEDPMANATSCVWNTAMMALSEVLCDAHVYRASQSGSMAVMVGVESMVKHTITSGVRLFGAMFPNSDPNDCWFLHEVDPAFYALPGGRLLRSIMMHLTSMDSLVRSFEEYDWSVDSELPVPLSIGCRELSSAVRYTQSSPEVVLAYSAPFVLFSLLRKTIKKLKVLSASMFKMTLASPVSSAVMDVSSLDDVKRAVLRIQGSVKTIFVFGTAAFYGDTDSIHLLLSKTASDPLLVRIGWDNVAKFDAVANDIDPKTNRDHRADTVEVDRVELLTFLKTRNARHCIGFGPFYEGVYDVLHSKFSYDELRAKITDYETPWARFSYPFACGSWTPPVKLLDAKLLNFDTVPVFCDLMLTAFESVTDNVSKKASATIGDRFAGYTYEEWNVYDKIQSPFLVEVDRETMSAWIAMSNPITTYSDLDDVDFGDSLPSPNMYDAFSTSRSRPVNSGLRREGANSMLWNAERIVQAAYSLMGFVEENDQRVIFVRTPRAWRASEKEREIRTFEERKISELLRAHNRMEPFVVSFYMNNVWDSILNVYRGLVQEVDVLGEGAASDQDDGAGAVPTAMLAVPPAIPRFTPAPGQVAQPQAIFPESQIRGGTLADEIYAPSNSIFFTDLQGVGEAPSVVVPEESAVPLDTTAGFETDGDGEEEDEKDATRDDAPDGRKDTEADPKTAKDDPDVAPELDPKTHKSTGSIPSFGTILSIMTKLKISGKFASYVKNTHDRYMRVVQHWKDKKRSLEEQLETTKRSNDEWETRVADMTDAFDTKLLLHTCCSIAVAQALIHHVVGDVVTLRIHPDDTRGSSPIVGRANTGLARIVSGLNACISQSIHWMTLGECVHMLEIVCSR